MAYHTTSLSSLREKWGRPAVPSLFFLAVIYYEELFLKLYCFHTLSPESALFTLLFTLPVAMLLGLLPGTAFAALP